MTAVPIHQVEAVLLAELARGPALLCDLAAALGRDETPALVFAEAALRSLRARGLVRSEAGPDGVMRWASNGPALPPQHAAGGPRRP